MLFRVQHLFVLLLVNRFDACKQLFVQADVVFMLAHHRHDFLGQFLQVIVRFCAEQIAEYGTDTVEHFAGLLIDQHSVGKCRDFRIADDGIYFRILAADAFADGGYIVSGLDFVERDSAVQRGVCFKKRILRRYSVHKAKQY